MEDIEVFGFISNTTPLRKTTTVQDFAKACVFFAADASNAVTGQSLSVDGGLTVMGLSSVRLPLRRPRGPLGLCPRFASCAVEKEEEEEQRGGGGGTFMQSLRGE